MFTLTWTTTAPAIDTTKIFCINGGRPDAQDHYLTVTDGTQTLKCFGLMGTTKFKDAVFAMNCLFIGFDTFLYAWSLGDDRLKKLELASKAGFDSFGSFYVDVRGRFILVATGTSLFKFDYTFREVWRTSGLGIDGVKITDVDSTSVSGSGEWISPQGVRPYKLNLKTGEAMQ